MKARPMSNVAEITNKPLTGKVALITGASRGIGRAIALRLAHDGADVVVNFAGAEQLAGDVVRLITEQGGAALACQADISDGAAVGAMFDHALAHFGRLDILVNNAGVAMALPAPLAQTTDADFDRLFAVNTRGGFNVLREASRRVADGGRIVSISTALTRLSVPGSGGYAGSKAAVEAMVRALASELGRRGITVNSVAPGMTETDMMRAVVPAEMQSQAGQMTTLGRLGQPDDIASVVSFLCGPDGSWLTGQTLFATGTT
jgi:3-oxoacyl-[acyl-carrier protein] reductase